MQVIKSNAIVLRLEYLDTLESINNLILMFKA